MNLKEQKAYYDNLWKHEEKLNSLNLRRAIKILEFFVVPKKEFHNLKVLDLGCGEGRLTAFVGEFCNAEGLELSSKAVEKANALYSNVHYYQGNALTYDFKGQSYEVVISQEVIEHIENQTEYLEICYNVLKKGGYLILTTPNKTVLDCMKNGKEWSNQPIENVLSAKKLKEMVSIRFKIINYDSLIFNFGDKRHFKLLNSRIFIGLCNKLGLKGLREHFYGKWGLGLHQIILAKKI